MKILITGGAGFIGSAVIRHLFKKDAHQIVNVDKLTYAANLANLATVAENPNYTFVQADVCDEATLKAVFEIHQPTRVVHLAAESHVDRSIDSPEPFVNTNIVGTYRLLNACIAWRDQLPADERDDFRFHHVSTDEVFGSLALDAPPFLPDDAYDPRSPYAASKAAADHLVRAWHHTYGLNVVLSNCSNNYGPYQFPEKLIPLMILNGLQGRAMPVYGDGRSIRDWLYVDDHAAALCQILFEGTNGETYFVGGSAEHSNLDVVAAICRLLDKVHPQGAPGGHERLIQFVEDRPGHDLRYAMDYSRTADRLGWRPSVSFDEGLKRTVNWYMERRDWWVPILAQSDQPARQGLAAASDGRARS